MAREESKRVSIRPSQAESGGTLGFPEGGKVTVVSCSWSEWGDAGESALKGGRAAEDPALKVVGEVEGMDKTVTEYLGAGKASRFVASADGEYLEPAEGSTAKAINDSCNAFIFLNSLCDVKRHGKMALPEEVLDNGASSIEGLVFIVGKEMVNRDFGAGSSDPGRKARPTTVSAQNITLPGGAKSKAKDTPTPTKTKANGKVAQAKEEDSDTDEVDLDEATEQAILSVLSQPKFRKGLPMGKVFSAVFNETKDSPHSKGIVELAEQDKWLAAKSRPWKVEDETIIAID